MSSLRRTFCPSSAVRVKAGALAPGSIQSLSFVGRVGGLLALARWRRLSGGGDDAYAGAPANPDPRPGC